MDDFWVFLRVVVLLKNEFWVWAVLTQCQYGSRTETVSVSVYTSKYYYKKWSKQYQKYIKAQSESSNSLYYKYYSTDPFFAGVKSVMKKAASRIIKTLIINIKNKKLYSYIKSYKCSIFYCSKLSFPLFKSWNELVI